MYRRYRNNLFIYLLFTVQRAFRIYVNTMKTLGNAAAAAPQTYNPPAE